MNSVVKMTAVSALAAGLIACGGDIKDNTTSPQNYHDIKVDLQGTVFNALTNAHIDLPKDAVILRQGTDYRNASTAKNWEGDFAFRNIPASVNSNVQYELRANVPGYQAFRAIMDFDINDAGAADLLQDKKANWVGNIYLYPVGVAAPDYQVVVTYNGERVPNAMVQLNQDVANNFATVGTANSIRPTSGLQPVLRAETDAQGVATFAGTNLVLGGSYGIQVLPVSYLGKQLAFDGNYTIANVGRAGSDIVNHVVMTDLLPGNDNGLYVVSASNEVENALRSDGVLTIKVSQPVELVNVKNTVTAELDSNDTPVRAQLDASGTGTEFTAAVSNDGLTITLSPRYATGGSPVVFSGANEATADNGLTITYSGLLVRMKDQQDAALYSVFDGAPLSGIFGLSTKFGTRVSGVVNITPEF